MGKINYGRVFSGGLLALLVLIATELIMERLILANISGVGGAKERFFEAFQKLPESGPVSDIIILVGGYITCCLFIWIYAAIRPRFGPGPKTALIVSAALVIYWALVLVWFTTVGVFPLKISVVSFIDTLIGTPLAVLAGAWAYRE
ncbi:MAG: hypothetical protein JSW34_14080 [Candidatus Zixiibacteriota bacterium]|nr:MAG: hypothetical protein JSW34_14080 [candidate division Zixibacteria bacterium]